MTAPALQGRAPAWRLRPSTARRPFPVDAALATSSALLVSLLVGLGLTRYPFLGGDEGIYTEQAWAVLQGDITPYVYTYDHPFLGWMQLAGLSWLVQALHLGSPLSVANVRVLMLLTSFLCMLLTYGIARRLDLARPTAVASVLIVGLSPLYATYARQVYLDSIALLWVLVAFYLVLNRSRNQWAYGAAGAAMAAAILSKETVLLLAPAVCLLLWQRAWKPLRLMSAGFFLTLGGMVLLVYPLFALLRKEFLPGEGHVSLLGDGVLYQLSGRVSSGALWENGSGRAVLVSQWLAFDRWLLLVGIACALLLLASRRLRVLGVVVLLWALPVVRPTGYMPSMYVIAVLPFLGLAVAGLGEEVWRRVRAVPPRAFPAVAGAVALVAALVSVGAGRSYVRGAELLVTADPVQSQEDALAWVRAHVDPADRVLTDDVFFVDLARLGFETPWKGAVSYYKYNLDPQALVEVPSWDDVDWVLETAEMRRLSGTEEYSRTAEVLQNSSVAASFGVDDALVVVRRVGLQPLPAPAPAAPAPAPAAPAPAAVAPAPAAVAPAPAPVPAPRTGQQPVPPPAAGPQRPADAGESDAARAVLERFANEIDVQERRRLLQEYWRLTGEAS